MELKKPLAFVLNFLVIPGLGNYILGAKRDGIIQISLMLLSVGIITLGLKNSYYIMPEALVSNYIPPEVAIKLLSQLIGGLVLAFIALGWAAFTYYKVLKQKPIET